MNARERYNSMISEIEAEASNRYKDADELLEEVAYRHTLDKRQLNTLFQFMTGETARSYITNRKLMAAYRHLIEAPRMDISGAIEISGLGSHSSLDKKFGKVFNLTPKEAYKYKDSSCIVPPMTWNMVSQRTDEKEHEGDMHVMVEDRVFGIPRSQYTAAMGAHELAEIHGFDSMFSSVAFDLAKELGKPLKDAFHYVASLREDYEDFSGKDDDPEDPTFSLHTPEENLREVASDPFYQFVFFQCGLPISAAYELLDRTGLTENQLMSRDSRILREYVKTAEMNFRYFEQVYGYYMENRGTEFAKDAYHQEDFDAFIDQVSIGVPMEVAFGSIIPSGVLGYDAEERIDSEEDIHEEREEMFDRLYEEELRWRNRRIDDVTDEENQIYDMDDLTGVLDF